MRGLWPLNRERLRQQLPRGVGVVGFVVYLATLNTWVSLQSVPTVARASGWLWRPQLGQPLTFLLLAPFKLLPESWIPLFLNVAAAAAASVVLALLVRSVALLPHDIAPARPFATEEPKSLLDLPLAWIPPLLAAVLCGLQLTFWEHATSASGEIVDVLLFAYVIRCLLEFQINSDQKWLSRAAFAFAVGMTNDWAFVGYFPVFILALIWARGLGGFLQREFLLRMTLWGTAGLGFYLLLPAIQSLSSHGDLQFWPGLRAHLKAQKDALSALRAPPFRMLALTSLLPLLVLSIRWKSHTIQLADDSRLGVFLNKTAGHGLHILFFFAALWLAFEPTFSPRHLNLGTPMLSYYYLLSLVFGYCAGYLLLFGVTGPKRKTALIPKFALYGLLLVLPVALFAWNLHSIRSTNGPGLRQFAHELYDDLPSGNSVLLSDDSNCLLLLRAELASHPHVKDVLSLETSSLVSARYLVQMAAQYPLRWPQAPPTNRTDFVRPGRIMNLISSFTRQEAVNCLKPNVGPLFEQWTTEPHGLAHSLTRRSTNVVPSPFATDRELIFADARIWQLRWTNTLERLGQKMSDLNTGPGASNHEFGQAFLPLLHLSPETNETGLFLSSLYSAELTRLGVALQRVDQWQQAKIWLSRALVLNPNNSSAFVNLEYNRHFQKGDKARLKPADLQRQLPALFNNTGDWRQALASNGPLDEPTTLFRLGRHFLASGGVRQAVDSLTRCIELAPDWEPPKLCLAQGYLQLDAWQLALEMTERCSGSNGLSGSSALGELLECRAAALMGLGRTNEALTCVDRFITDYGDHKEVLSSAAAIFHRIGQFERELSMLDDLLKRDPENAIVLTRKGTAQLQLAQFGPAIVTLTKSLNLAPSEDTRLCRAIAYLGTGELESARKDYQELVGKPGTSQNALFGLGTIGWRQRDTNAAMKYYEWFLTNAPAGTVQYSQASQRFKELQPR